MSTAAVIGILKGSDNVQGDNSYQNCLPSEKSSTLSTLKGKNLLLMEANSFPLE